MKEEWKDINGYEDYYQISNYGNIRSLDRVVSHKKLGLIKIKGKILKYIKNKKGYYQVSLIRDGLKKSYRIHRLVAKMFIPNPNNYDQVNHIDGNKLNNKIINLEWCNNEYNMKHSIDIGLRKNSYNKGINHHNSKFSKDDILDIRSKYKFREYTIGMLANEYNVNKLTIHKILHYISYN